MGCGASAGVAKQAVATPLTAVAPPTEAVPQAEAASASVLQPIDVSWSGHADRRLSHDFGNSDAEPRNRSGTPISNLNTGSTISGSGGSGTEFSVHTNSDDSANPAVVASLHSNSSPPTEAILLTRSASRGSLSSLSIFSPASLCDRAEFVRRYRGGYVDETGLHFPTPEERHSTLEAELRAARSGGNPADVITGRGMLWVHQYLNDGLPVPLEAFRSELYDASDNPRLERFQMVVAQISEPCLRLLLRRSSVLDIDMCLARTTELVKQSTRTPCTDRLKVALQQQVVKLHDLLVAVQHTDAILSALRYDDFNHLRAIFDSRVDASSSRKDRRTRRRVDQRPCPSPQNPAAPVSSTAFVFASFTEFVQVTLRDYVEYSLLTTISIATQPPPILRLSV